MNNSPLLDLIDQNGRINYTGLTHLARRNREDHFLSYVKHPFLMGKDLYEGMIYRDHFHEDKTTPIKRTKVVDDTSIFEKFENEIKELSNVSMSHAIFTLRKKPFSEENPNIITIGRSIKNDLVVADYTISRVHAQITIYYGKYFLQDAGSTNATCLNGYELEADEKLELHPGSLVAFGRLVFKWLSGKEIYEILRVK